VADGRVEIGGVEASRNSTCESESFASLRIHALAHSAPVKIKRAHAATAIFSKPAIPYASPVLIILASDTIDMPSPITPTAMSTI